jgi:hypothetical protein
MAKKQRLRQNGSSTYFFRAGGDFVPILSGVGWTVGNPRPWYRFLAMEREPLISVGDYPQGRPKSRNPLQYLVEEENSWSFEFGVSFHHNTLTPSFARA